MPKVTVQHVQGAFTRAQQTQLMHDITAAFVKIGGAGILPAVDVVITEIPSGLWCWGGEIQTLEAIEKRRAQRRAAQTSSRHAAVKPSRRNPTSPTVKDVARRFARERYGAKARVP